MPHAIEAVHSQGWSRSDGNAREASRGKLFRRSCVIDKHNFPRFECQPHFFEAASITYNSIELRGS